jgi:hypothetical protein
MTNETANFVRIAPESAHFFTTGYSWKKPDIHCSIRGTPSTGFFLNDRRETAAFSLARRNTIHTGQTMLDSSFLIVILVQIFDVSNGYKIRLST